jgi:hypothetical protein
MLPRQQIELAQMFANFILLFGALQRTCFSATNFCTLLFREISPVVY